MPYPHERAFQLDQTEEAFEHLQLTAAERDAVTVALGEIASELGAGEQPRSAPAPSGRSDVP